MEAVWLLVLESAAFRSSTWPSKGTCFIAQAAHCHLPRGNVPSLLPPEPGLGTSTLPLTEICLAGLCRDQCLLSQKWQSHLLPRTWKGAFAHNKKIWGGWGANLSQNSKFFTHLLDSLGKNASSSTNSPQLLGTPESSELLRSLNAVQVGYVKFIT